MFKIGKPRGKAEASEMFEMRYDLLHRYIGFPREKPVVKKNQTPLVAVLNGKAVGTGTLSIERGKSHIQYVAVKRKFRHRRIGSKTVQKLEERARRKGVKAIYVNSRKHAKKFFKQLGYKSTGKLFKHSKIGTLHIRMEKEL